MNTVSAGPEWGGLEPEMNEARFVVCRAGGTDTKYQGGANEMRTTRVTGGQLEKAVGEQ
jgi:hypothetical protein